MFKWYKGQITNALSKSGTKTGYVAKVHAPNTITKQQIVKELAYDMSIEEAEAELFVDEFTNQLANSIGTGMNVKLDGFGSFSSSLTTRSAATADEVTTDNIIRMNINFRLDKNFQKEVSNVKMEEATDLAIKHIK